MLRKIPRKFAKSLKIPMRCRISYEKMKIYKPIGDIDSYEELDIPEQEIKDLITKLQNNEI